MADLHKGILATLDPDHAQLVQREPKRSVRMVAANGRCAEAHAVEMEAQQHTTSGIMMVRIYRFNARTNEHDLIFAMEVPPPGELWEYEKRGRA